MHTRTHQHDKKIKWELEMLDSGPKNRPCMQERWFDSGNASLQQDPREIDVSGISYSPPSDLWVPQTTCLAPSARDLTRSHLVRLVRCCPPTGDHIKASPEPEPCLWGLPLTSDVPGQEGHSAGGHASLQYGAGAGEAEHMFV